MAKHWLLHGMKIGTAICVSLSASSHCEGQTRQFPCLPRLNTDYFYAEKANAVSADGRHVIAIAPDDSNNSPVRWHKQRVLGQWLWNVHRIGSNEYPGAEPIDISWHGDTVVGSNGGYATRWKITSDDNTTAELLCLGKALAVSPEGKIVVGFQDFPAYKYQAFVWREGDTEVSLLPTPEGYNSDAVAISGDGSVIAGNLHRGSHTTAVRWVLNGNSYQLEYLFDQSTFSRAYDISYSGSVVVGTTSTSAYIWSANYTTYINDVRLTAVSADGTIAVGSTAQDVGVRWTSEGIQILTEAYDIPEFVVNLQPTNISPDGRYIVGGAGNSDCDYFYGPFYLDTGCRAHNGDVVFNYCVNDEDLLAVLFAFGDSGDDLGREDVNCDGVVDDADLLIVLFNFADGCQS